ncbi:MAG TPA: DEAD/DEAH box helicase [Phototrophicaceae bacterium]|nr:DEAD/DEAH box helicase [Phototrophicaceae bacterium]
MSRSLVFQGGTLVLYDVEQEAEVLPAFRWIKSRWRCEAYHYPTLLGWLRDHEISNTLPRWQHLDLTLHDAREPHEYQIAALDAWEAADRRGSIVLPTGAGKTFVAIHAIQRVNRSTLVVAPTIDLLHQWYARLVNAFQTEVGVYYGAEKIIHPLTVTTYHSAGDLIAAQGNAFKLIIFDEVHHLPAPSWGESALMSPSPFRLGLTATYPDAEEEANSRWRIDDLIGSIVFEQRIDDLIGAQLAEYRTERIYVDLTPAERALYDADYAIYSDYFRSNQLPQKHGRWWLQEMMRRGSFDTDARAALLARLRLIRLLSQADNKLAALEALLKEYAHEQSLIFTESNDAVYAISRRHLIPALTHETTAAERKYILDQYQAGNYRSIATSRVLNEGIDVPEAKVAIVLGGTASAREYIQRLGRVLRKVGSRQAYLFEVLVRDSVEIGRSQRRHRYADQ